MLKLLVVVWTVVQSLQINEHINFFLGRVSAWSAIVVFNWAPPTVCPPVLDTSSYLSLSGEGLLVVFLASFAILISVYHSVFYVLCQFIWRRSSEYDVLILDLSMMFLYWSVNKELYFNLGESIWFTADWPPAWPRAAQFLIYLHFISKIILVLFPTESTYYDWIASNHNFNLE